MSDSVRARLRVTGRVQGVGFRWFVKETARRLDLAGWVRNAPDGSVELEAEGTPEAIDALRAALVEGPPAARVDAVHALPGDERPLPRPFSVDR